VQADETVKRFQAIIPGARQPALDLCRLLRQAGKDQGCSPDTSYQSLIAFSKQRPQGDGQVHRTVQIPGAGSV